MEVGSFLLAAAAVLAELASLVLVGSYVGWLATFGLLALAMVLGVVVISGRGAATIRDVVLALRDGRSPGNALIDGALLAIAGLLLITPGFASDALGVLLILPPTRAGARAWLKRKVHARIARVRGPDGFVGHSDGEAPEGIEVIDVSGVETPDRRRPRGPSLPS